jgi:hypothetical protein
MWVCIQLDIATYLQCALINEISTHDGISEKDYSKSFRHMAPSILPLTSLKVI